MKYIMVFLIILFLPFNICLAQQAKQVRTIDGQVTDTDWVGSKIVVNIGGDEMTFILPDNIVVTRGTDTLSVNDIDQNDSVTIYYTDEGINGLKAVKITDNSPL
ncbi:MAG TPA: hypothetical protein PLU24_06005 [Candidatus Omnitrophota bacterium]|nr:hypothetical protein [Candidatus Omnitrophota bacterium]